MELITDKDGLFSVATETLLRHEPRLKHVTTLDLDEFVLPEVTEVDGKRFRTYFDVGKVCRGWFRGSMIKSLNISNSQYGDQGEQTSVEFNLPPSRGTRNDFNNGGVGKTESKWSVSGKEWGDIDTQIGDIVSNVDLREHLRCTTEVHIELPRRLLLTRGKNMYLIHAVFQITKPNSVHILDQEYNITLRVCTRHYVTRKPLKNLRPHPLGELLSELSQLDDKLTPWATSEDKNKYKLTDVKPTHRKWYQVLLDKMRKDRNGDDSSKRNTTLSDTDTDNTPSKEKASPEHDGEKDTVAIVMTPSEGHTIESKDRNEIKQSADAEQEGDMQTPTREQIGSESEDGGVYDGEEKIEAIDFSLQLESEPVKPDEDENAERKAFFSETVVTTTTSNTSTPGDDGQEGPDVTVATTSSSAVSTEARKVTKTTTTTTTSHVHFQSTDGSGDGLEDGTEIVAPTTGDDGNNVVYKQETVTTVTTSTTEGGEDMSPVQVIIEESPPQNGEAEFPTVTIETINDDDPINPEEGVTE